MPGVLGCSFDRLRTGSPCDVLFKYGIQSRGTAARFPGTRLKRLRWAWHSHLHGLVTSIRETSGRKVSSVVRLRRAQSSSGPLSVAPLAHCVFGAAQSSYVPVDYPLLHALCPMPYHGQLTIRAPVISLNLIASIRVGYLVVEFPQYIREH
jgi:hypothetical protein